MEITSKDIWLYITDFVEDVDILNMLSVNKKFNNPEFFEMIIRKRYPYLLKFKDENLDWKRYYIQIIYSLAKLEEKFNVPYINHPNYNPIKLYKKYYDDRINIYKNTLKYAKETDDEELIEHLKFMKNVDENLYDAIKSLDLDLVEELVERGGSDQSSGGLGLYETIYAAIYHDGKGEDIKPYLDIARFLINNKVSPIYRETRKLKYKTENEEIRNLLDI